MDEAAIGSLDKENAKEREKHYSEERDKAQEVLNQLNIRFGQSPISQGGAPLSTRRGPYPLSKAPKLQEIDDLIDEFEFVKPAGFDDKLKILTETMKTGFVRDLGFLVCTGPMGVGKTRTGKELLKAARNLRPTWKCGFIKTASLLPSYDDVNAINDIDLCCYVLACALFRAFLPEESPEKYELDFSKMVNKVNKELGDRILIQVDEFSHNALAVRMLLRACAFIKADQKRQLNVVPVMSGIRSATNLAMLPEGTYYHVEYYDLLPLKSDDGATTESLVFSFMRRIKIDPAKFDECIRLQNLITDCAGFPASLEYLAGEILTLDPPDLLTQLRENGTLDVNEAKTIYEAMIGNVAFRYGEARWANVFLAPGNHNRQHISVRTKAILRRLLLNVLTCVDVKPDDVISPDHDLTITYALAEYGGLVSLKRRPDTDFYQLSLPMLAVSSMNKFLRAIQGRVLDNPFEYGFEIHEELALVSMQAYLRRMAAAKVKTCRLKDLRPGAFFAGSADDLLIEVPTECNIVKVGKLFDGGVDLRSGAEGKSGPPSEDPGTFLMAAVGQKSVDGAGLLNGTFNNKNCTILVLSQSKWSQLFSTTKIQPSSANEIVQKLSAIKDSVLTAWLPKVNKKRLFVIYDVFSDRPRGSRMEESHVQAPPKENCAVAVTTEECIQEVVGHVLGIRARLKRIGEDERKQEELKRRRS